MGFTRNQARAALRCCSTAEAAVQWIVAHGSECDEQDTSEEDGNKTTDNIGAIESMQTLVVEFAYNTTVVQQLEKLSSRFSWRRVKGDGNCYPRAVMFAWLTRCLWDGSLDRIQMLSRSLLQYENTPGLPVKQYR